MHLEVKYQPYPNMRVTISCLMSQVSVKCPGCAKQLCTFQSGKLFTHCNKCGSTVERDLKNNVKIFCFESEEDENIIFANELTEECSAMVLPTREKFDIESFDYEVEKIMDKLMTFNEVMKDIFNSIESMDNHKKLRTCELCAEMTDRIFKQYKPFVQEYEDYGMFNALKETNDGFVSKLNQLSTAFASDSERRFKEYWAERKEQYDELQSKLADAKNRKSKTLFFDLQANWEIDNEIAAIEEQLNNIW